MTLDDFDKGMARLERMFNRATALADDVRLEYLHALRFLEAPAFEAAITMVIETFKPFPSEPFPSLFTVQDAVTMAQSDDQVSWLGQRGAPDASAADFCQLCRNRGLYLAPDDKAHFCRCERGRLRRASWDVPYGARKREAKVQDALDKLPPSKGPVHDLQEKNGLGFWEDTQGEHDRWMAAKRIKIEEIKKRRAERPEKKLSPSDELRFELLKDTVAKLGLRRELPAPAECEPGEDEEEEAPF